MLLLFHEQTSFETLQTVRILLRSLTIDSCISLNNTVNHLKFGQQLLGLTLRVNP